MTRQLVLDLPVRAALGRGDFFVSPANAAALAAVDGWRGWPEMRLMLVGPEGAGKTHLARLWQGDRPGTAWVEGAEIAAADLPALSATGAVVDGADAAAGHPGGERALLHLVNLARSEGAPLLMTARTPVRDWALALPDLASRLAATAVAVLPEPDDHLLAAVLVKLFADRQIVVGPEVVDYLLPRMERRLGTAGRIVAALDAEALAQGRPITVRLAGQVLDAQG